MRPTIPEAVTASLFSKARGALGGVDSCRDLLKLGSGCSLSVGTEDFGEWLGSGKEITKYYISTTWSISF